MDLKNQACDHVISCLGGNKTVLEPRRRPEPAAGELLIRMRVSGLCGTDLFKLSTNAAAPGTVLGHEVVGDVVSVGDGVDRFAAGERIVVPHHVACGQCLFCQRGNETMCDTFRENLMAPGGFADHIVIRPRATQMAAFTLPDDVSDEAGVFVEPGACVLRGIDRSGLQAGTTAVVFGAGSMGLLHLLVLKAAVPGITVIMVDPDESRLQFAAGLGATACAVPGETARAATNSATNGAGADAVFDTVGGSPVLQAALDLTRHGGSVMLFAHAPPDAPAPVDLNNIFKYERRIIGTYSGALGEQKRIFDMICDGLLDPSPLVTHTMPLDDFAHGVELASNRCALKVLFTPSRGSRQ
ncbi:MAG: zinc-dependent alcohol dehydrogenase [Aestuariivirgaceae bacterium]